MFRFLVVGAVALTLVAAVLLPVAPGTAQAAGEGFVTVGEDPAGDSTNDIVPGVDADAVVTSERTDILALDLKLDGDSLLVRMAIGATPTGTSGYLYDVFFDVAGETYFTCFTTQWVGGAESAENIKGCSRFTEGTQVGAETTADGVIVDGEGPGYVTWPVPLADIGAQDGDTLDNVVAETWFRGVADCCLGSTTDSQYMWNRADVAPDEGVWTATVGGGEGAGAMLPDLALEDVDAPSSVTEGARFMVNATVVITGEPANGSSYPLSSSLSGVPWNNTTQPDVVELDANATSADLTLVVDVPSGTAGTEVDLTWLVCHADRPEPDANATRAACGEATFSVSVRAPGGEGPPVDASPDPTGSSDNATANETENAPEEESLPGPGAALATAVSLALLAAHRRRR